MNTNVPHGYSVVPTGPDRLRDMIDIDRWAFIAPGAVDDDLAGESPRDWDRQYAVAAPDGRLAAFHFSLRLERFAVPGAFVQTAGLSGVSVHPEHRRRGLLTAMIAAHLERCAEHGEPLSVLNASEPAIYGRYGYGMASRRVRVAVPRGAALREVPGTGDVVVHIDHAVQERYLDAVMHVQENAAHQVGLVRPGWISWETPNIAAEHFRDPATARDGAETLRLMIAERAGEPVGFAFFRRKADWAQGGSPRGEVFAGPMAYTDSAAAHAIWSRLVDLDLMVTTYATHLSLDDPLFGQLVDQRAAAPTISDGLWLRIIDLPRALAARQYAAPVDVVLDVTDSSIPANAGRWHLRAEAFADGADIARTTAAPDIQLDIQELGAIYLGGTNLAALVASGLAEARTAGILARTATAFNWPVAPAFNWDF